MSFGSWIRAVRNSDRLPGRNLVLLREVDSTNRYARSLLGRSVNECDAPDEFAVAAYEQTAGRGRLGRSWSSQAGLGLYITLAHPVPGDQEGSARCLQSLPLLVGVAICEAVAPMVSGSTGLKWPNDVLIDGKKVAGILIETFSTGDRPSHALIGFGLNHGHSAGQLPTEASTSIALESNTGPPELGELFVSVLCSVEAGLGRSGDLDHAIENYRSWSLHQAGDRVTCRMGGRSVEGSFIGFDSRGHLRLRCAEGEVLVSAGEVVEPVGAGDE